MKKKIGNSKINSKLNLKNLAWQHNYVKNCEKYFNLEDPMIPLEWKEFYIYYKIKKLIYFI